MHRLYVKVSFSIIYLCIQQGALPSSVGRRLSDVTETGLNSISSRLVEPQLTHVSKYQNLQVIIGAGVVLMACHSA